MSFLEIPHGRTETHLVAPGHEVQILIRWGDPVYPNAPSWNTHAQTAAAQELQFGYSNDFIAFFPLPYGTQSSDHGLLCINHEYSQPNLMFSGLGQQPTGRNQVDVELAAVGHTIIEIRLNNGIWEVERSSAYNRRITGLTEIAISGPAAGHTRMRTEQDSTGRDVRGTIGNCAGGQTPWGTVLTAEENLQDFFDGDPHGTSKAANHLTMNVGTPGLHSWFRFHDRFDVSKEPNEPNRFGWIVEIDPYDPGRNPVKRTALGRFKHEEAGVAVNHDGRLVCYMGDNKIFQYVYKFVSARPVDDADRDSNWDLLDDGTLYVARFEDDGDLAWRPLIWGRGPLTTENGFLSQADVLIQTRRAAMLLRATPMDRPEDIEVSPSTNTIFVALTKNKNHGADNIDGANPRAANRYGHIRELVPADTPNGRDHTADTFQWRPFLLAGDPRDPKSGADYNAAVSDQGWLLCPDNLIFDNSGRLWITADGAEDFGYADGLWATDISGAERALTRHFFRCPRGAELTGPAFTPDGSTLFCSIQHPGDGRNASFEHPSTRWPDFEDDVPPRPSVIAIRRSDGTPIG